MTRYLWGWFVVRDDGDRMEGPYETEAEARERLRIMYDPSEYRVDLQYSDGGLM